MWKLRFFVNCSGWQINAEFGKRGYLNTHYFNTKKEAKDWLKYQNKRLPNNPVDLILLQRVTKKEYLNDLA